MPSTTFEYTSEAAREEHRLIMRQLQEYFPIDTGRVALAVNSDQALFALKTLAAQEQLPITDLGLARPALGSTDTVRALLRQIKDRYPTLRWHVQHGLADERVPIQKAREWVDMIRSEGFEIDYVEEPHTSHLVHLFSPIKAFYLRMGGRAFHDRWVIGESEFQ